MSFKLRWLDAVIRNPPYDSSGAVATGNTIVSTTSVYIVAAIPAKKSCGRYKAIILTNVQINIDRSYQKFVDTTGTCVVKLWMRRVCETMAW